MTLLICLCTIFILGSNARPLRNQYQHYLELPSVDRFREYLRIDTSKEENLKYAVEFWIRQSKILGLPYAIYAPAGKPIFVATLQGSDPSLPSIMLNSHMDVVKVDEKEWAHPPFDAVMDNNGDIYGRGTQDTKDVGIQYLEAIRRLKKDNITLARTLHVTVMPDEEAGGRNGMKAFVKTKEFKSLNIGFALDEGLTTSGDTLLASFVDKRALQMEFLIHGVGGHGSTMPEGSAMDNAYKFINAVMAYRETQKKIIKSNNTRGAAGYTSLNINLIDVQNRTTNTMQWISQSEDPRKCPRKFLVYSEMEFLIHGVGGHGSTMPEGSAMDNAYKFINAVMAYRETQKKIIKSNNTRGAAGYTSLNINLIDGGLAANIIPSEMKIVVDMRLATDADTALMQLVVNQWMEGTGNNTEVTYLRRETKSGITSVDETNVYWVTMRDTLTKIGVKFRPTVLPATSDMLVLRNLGIPAIGFCTKINTTPRLHAKDEYQNVETFLKGIDIYTESIKSLGNTPSETVKEEYLKNKKKCQY